MKKILAITLASLTAISCITACGKKDGDNNNSDMISGQQEQAKARTPDEYLDYILVTNGEIPLAIKNSFNKIKPVSDNRAGSAKLDLSVGEGTGNFISAIDTEAGQFYTNSFAWFKNLGLDFDAGINGTDLIKLAAGISLNDVKIATLDFTAAMNKGEFWFAVPELTAKTLYLKAPEGTFDTAAPKALMNVYPDGEMAERLYIKYMQTILDKIDVRERKETALTVGNVSAPVNLMEIELTEELVTDMGISITETALVDPDIKTFITNLASYQASLGYTDADQFISDAYDGMNEILGDLREKKNGGEFDTTKVYVDISTDSDDNIVGLKIHPHASENEITYAYAENDGVFAHEFTVDGTKLLYGNGTVTNGKLSGSYAISDADGNVIVNAIVNEFDKNALDNGLLNGSITAKLAPEFVAEFGLPTMVNHCDLRLDLAQTSEASYSIALTLNHNNAKVATLTLTGTAKEASVISLPTDALDIASEGAMETLMSSVNLGNVYSKLNEAGAGQIATLIQLALMSLGR